MKPGTGIGGQSGDMETVVCPAEMAAPATGHLASGLPQRRSEIGDMDVSIRSGRHAAARLDLAGNHGNRNLCAYRCGEGRTSRSRPVALSVMSGQRSGRTGQ